MEFRAGVSRRLYEQYSGAGIELVHEQVFGVRGEEGVWLVRALEPHL